MLCKEGSGCWFGIAVASLYVKAAQSYFCAGPFQALCREADILRTICHREGLSERGGANEDTGQQRGQFRFVAEHWD